MSDRCENKIITSTDELYGKGFLDIYVYIDLFRLGTQVNIQFYCAVFSAISTNYGFDKAFCL